MGYSKRAGEQGWRGGESTRLPQCGPGSNPGERHRVCCWFSPLLQVFLRVLRFSPLLKNQHFQIPVRPGIRQTKNHYVDVLLQSYLFLFIYLQVYKKGETVRAFEPLTK